jgi:5-methylthioadenosine/S-adenosylhomocysteine deaminase
MSTIRIEGGLIVTMNENRSILKGGRLVIKDDRITEISKSPFKTTAGKGETVIDARGKIVLPGFINTHMHQRPMRGIADGFDLRVWHDIYIDEVSDLMRPPDAYAGASAGFAEALKGGITTVMAGAIHPRSEYKAAQEVGIRARFFAHVINEDECDQFFDLVASQGGTEEDRVRYWVGLEVASLSTSRTRRRARQLASDQGLRIHTHFSEEKRHDPLPLIEDGFLGPDVHLAHCVQLTPEDMETLAKYGVKVAHCPTSNLKLGNGIAPVPAMRALGIPVGIATDGIIGTGRIDLFEQMRIAGLIQRGSHLDAKLLPVEDLLSMVTREAAGVMGMETQVGSLEPGKKADIVILNTDRIWLTPQVHTDKISNIMQLIVWSATPMDVDTVLVDGKVVVKKGQLKTQDEEEIRSRVQRVGKRILKDAHFEKRTVRPS